MPTVDEVPLPHLYGLDDGGQFIRYDPGVRLHYSVALPVRRLVDAAALDGVLIRVCSGHRTFAEQLRIWNRKAQGKQALLDGNERRVDATTLSEDSLIESILRWSALPGASRHHWGTDMDVYDAAVVPRGYDPELTIHESESRFAVMHAWLDANMHVFAFYRPYSRDLGGVAPEPWHISYAPLATRNLEVFSLATLRQVLEPAQMELKERVLERLPELFERYVTRVTAPRPLS